jgi:hypothetical protein
MVQVSLGKKARPHLQNNQGKKGLEVWFKWQNAKP